MPYELEYKRTVDSTWTVYSTALTLGQFPATIPGLVVGTQYDVRCRARDVAGNASAYSAVSQATTTSGDWTATVPALSVQRGSSVSLTAYLKNAGVGETLHVSKIAQGDAADSPDLPSGVTIDNTDGAQRLVATSGATLGTTTGVILIAQASSSSADFTTRRNTGRVIYSTDFSSASDFTLNTKVFGANDATGTAYWQSLVTQDSTDPRLPKCLKVNSPRTTGANGAAWYTSLNPGGFPGTSALGGAWTLESQGLQGIPFYVQVRLKIPSSRLIARDSAGYKYFDVSAYSIVDPPNRSYSNTSYEIIGQVEFPQHSDGSMAAPLSYHRDASGGFPLFYNPPDPVTSGFFVSRQDNGVGVSDPLQRYCIYNPSAYGTATLTPGCFQFQPDTWVTIDLFINMQTLGGTAGNQYKMWVTPQDGTTRVQLLNETSVSFGTDARFTGGPCGMWLNAYETSLVLHGTEVDTYQKWGQAIVSLDPIALPAVGS